MHQLTFELNNQFIPERHAKKYQTSGDIWQRVEIL
jgi:hypothetical protein